MGLYTHGAFFERDKYMFDLTINNSTYKVQFGYNQFIDTDLMDRVKSIVRIMVSAEDANDLTAEDVENLTEDDVEVALRNFDLLKEVFATTRELIYVGFQKHNPLLNILAAGDLMDEYDGNVQELFMLFVNELFAAGFLGDLIQTEKGQAKKPRKRSTTKATPTT